MSSQLFFSISISSALIDLRGTWTHNHLVYKQTLNHLAKLAKWLRCFVSTYLSGAFNCMLLCHIHVPEWIFTLYLPECQGTLTQNRRMCGFTLKYICDMIRTYSEMCCTDMYLQHRSIIWVVWLNGWVFGYKLSGCGLKYCWGQLGCCSLKYWKMIDNNWLWVRLLPQSLKLQILHLFRASSLRIRQL